MISTKRNSELLDELLDQLSKVEARIERMPVDRYFNRIENQVENRIELFGLGKQLNECELDAVLGLCQALADSGNRGTGEVMA